LVVKGVPFREAHVLVGKLVLYGVRQHKRLTELTLDEFQAFSPHFDSQVLAALEPRAIVGRRNIPGGTSPKQVAAALKRAKRTLQEDALSPGG